MAERINCRYINYGGGKNPELELMGIILLDEAPTCSKHLNEIADELERREKIYKSRPTYMRRQCNLVCGHRCPYNGPFPAEADANPKA